MLHLKVISAENGGCFLGFQAIQEQQQGPVPLVILESERKAIV